jgi:hypothetical protein
MAPLYAGRIARAVPLRSTTEAVGKNIRNYNKLRRYEKPGKANEYVKRLSLLSLDSRHRDG